MSRCGRCRSCRGRGCRTRESGAPSPPHSGRGTSRKASDKTLELPSWSSCRQTLKIWFHFFWNKNLRSKNSKISLWLNASSSSGKMTWQIYLFSFYYPVDLIRRKSDLLDSEKGFKKVVLFWILVILLKKMSKKRITSISYFLLNYCIILLIHNYLVIVITKSKVWVIRTFLLSSIKRTGFKFVTKSDRLWKTRETKNILQVKKEEKLRSGRNNFQLKFKNCQETRLWFICNDSSTQQGGNTDDNFNNELINILLQ